MQHVELAIIKGVQKIPGDTLSAERGLVPLSLLDPNGISLAANGWIPKNAQVKGGGVFAGNNLTQQEAMVGAALGRVVETMTLKIGGANPIYQLRKLLRMGQEARDFHSTEFQIEPVYLKWHAPGAPRPQYALIFTIDVSPTLDAFLAGTSQEVTMTVTREHGWCGLAPGDNPKHWYYIKAGLEVTWNATNAHLLSGDDHLFKNSVNNRREWDVAGTATISQNYVDIPGADIPGDLPARVYISMRPVTGTFQQVFIGRTTKPTSVPNRYTTPYSASQLIAYHVLNMGDGSMGSNTTVQADVTAPNANSAGAGRNATVAFVGTGMAARVTFGGVTGDESWIDVNLMRGRYRALLRARPTVGTDTINLQLGYGDSANSTILNTPVRMASATGGWTVHDLGVINIPIANRSISRIEGTGLEASTKTANMNFSITILAERAAGTGNALLSDLFLIPIDECGGLIDANATPTAAIMDNTGYSTHGYPSLEVAAITELSTADGLVYRRNSAAEFSGQELYLEPGVNNRLHFLIMDNNLISSIGQNLTIRVNIVPRWTGIIDT